jgi:hypothetical protein
MPTMRPYRTAAAAVGLRGACQRTATPTFCGERTAQTICYGRVSLSFENRRDASMMVKIFVSRANKDIIRMTACGSNISVKQAGHCRVELHQRNQRIAPIVSLFIETVHSPLR